MWASANYHLADWCLKESGCVTLEALQLVVWGGLNASEWPIAARDSLGATGAT